VWISKGHTQKLKKECDGGMVGAVEDDSAPIEHS